MNLFKCKWEKAFSPFRLQGVLSWVLGKKNQVPYFSALDIVPDHLTCTLDSQNAANLPSLFFWPVGYSIFEIIIFAHTTSCSLPFSEAGIYIIALMVFTSETHQIQLWLLQYKTILHISSPSWFLTWASVRKKCPVFRYCAVYGRMMQMLLQSALSWLTDRVA